MPRITARPARLFAKFRAKKVSKSPTFLHLPQELRDAIWEFYINDEEPTGHINRLEQRKTVKEKILRIRQGKKSFKGLAAPLLVCWQIHIEYARVLFPKSFLTLHVNNQRADDPANWSLPAQFLETVRSCKIHLHVNEELNDRLMEWAYPDLALSPSSGLTPETPALFQSVTSFIERGEHIKHMFVSTEVPSGYSLPSSAQWSLTGALIEAARRNPSIESLTVVELWPTFLDKYLFATSQYVCDVMKMTKMKTGRFQIRSWEVSSPRHVECGLVCTCGGDWKETMAEFFWTQFL